MLVSSDEDADQEESSREKTAILKKQDEAEKQFEKFRKLVPRNHPYSYREYFMDNMVATKLFAEKAQREMTGSKS
ncbi:unnamed protein product [Microthlaspi erraticum]|uniref:Uncharacterized protein n=1 Tax=Microthlaspi erraticum TaxID=1685480 RepID=A0A6D2JYH7_9BRAS|nr:unnamed protein product [Microthlaspi erraticum]